MKKALSIFLSILIILCSCTGFAASALANNFSSEIDIQKAPRIMKILRLLTVLVIAAS